MAGRADAYLPRCTVVAPFSPTFTMSGRSSRPARGDLNTRPGESPDGELGSTEDDRRLPPFRAAFRIHVHDPHDDVDPRKPFSPETWTRGCASSSLPPHPSASACQVVRRRERAWGGTLDFLHHTVHSSGQHWWSNRSETGGLPAPRRALGGSFEETLNWKTMVNTDNPAHAPSMATLNSTLLQPLNSFEKMLPE